MPTQHSDCELISACHEGEAWAWDALVDRYKGLVYSVALRAGLSQEDAADVFQTVFARLLEHLGTIHAPQGLAAWLITTTKREAWSVVRKQQREPAEGEVPVLLDTADLWPTNPRPDEDGWSTASSSARRWPSWASAVASYSGFCTLNPANPPTRRLAGS